MDSDKKRAAYDRQSKIDAMNPLVKGGHSVREVARDQGIDSNRLYHFRSFRAAVKEAGLSDDLHLHSLRHTFATWLVQSGVGIYEVQKLMGHSSVAVTQVCAHLAPSELHSAVEKISVSLN